MLDDDEDRMGMRRDESKEVDDEDVECGIRKSDDTLPPSSLLFDGASKKTDPGHVGEVEAVVAMCEQDTTVGNEDMTTTRRPDTGTDDDNTEEFPSSPCYRRKVFADAYGISKPPTDEFGEDDREFGSVELQLIDIQVIEQSVPTMDLSDLSTSDLLGARFCELTDNDALASLEPESDGDCRDENGSIFHTQLHLHCVDEYGRSVVVIVGDGTASQRFGSFLPHVQMQFTHPGRRTKDEIRECMEGVHKHLCRVYSLEMDMAMKLFPYEESHSPLFVSYDPVPPTASNSGGRLDTDSCATTRQTHTIITMSFPNVTMQRTVKYRDWSKTLGLNVIDKKREITTAFLIRHKLDACGWLTLSSPYMVPLSRRTTSATLEFIVSVDQITRSERREAAPLLIASYDIETYGSRGLGVMPDASIPDDYICAITTNFYRHGQNGSTFNVVQIVGDAPAKDHGHETCVEAYQTETELLLAWSELMRKTRPTVLAAYNCTRFDTHYLSVRANRIADEAQRRAFWRFGAYLLAPVQEREFRMESSAYGQTEGYVFTMPGTIQLDVMVWIAQNYKLALYNLNFVSRHFLSGRCKTDLDIGTMWRLVEQRKFDRLIAYVRRDGELTAELIQNRDILNAVCEMSRATSTFPNDVLQRGQQIRVFNAFRRSCDADDIAINATDPCIKRRYIGARVVAPAAGFYDPKNGYCVTLDFASLYPSIICAYNLCYQTYIPPHRINNFKSTYPRLEITEYHLELGQVWEETSRDACIGPRSTRRPMISKTFTQTATAQLKKKYAAISLTLDEFDVMLREIGSHSGCGGVSEDAYASVACPSSSPPKVRYFVPKRVSHYFAKGVPDKDDPQKETRCPSVLPRILERLGKLRKQAKRDMAAAEERGDHGAAALYDKAQQSFKVVMNSIYGFTAADSMRLLALAETITALGRRGLQDSIQIAERVASEMGFPKSRVIYGDTDSCFVWIDGASKEQAIDVGSKISSECNLFFERQTRSTKLKLEFEALFDGLILIGKKTYAGLQHVISENGSTSRKVYNGKEYEIDDYTCSAMSKEYKKGVRAVRHDSCLFVKETQSKSMSLLLQTLDIDSVLRYLNEQLQKLLSMQLSRRELQITNKLKRESDYKKDEADEIAKIPHLRVAKKLEERSRRGELPQGCVLYTVGDRVAYFFKEAESGAVTNLACDRAECPVYGDFHAIPYDVAHYFNLFVSALDQGLGVVPRVKQWTDEMYTQHIRPIEEARKKRMKQAIDRASVDTTTQNLISRWIVTRETEQREPPAATSASSDASRGARGSASASTQRQTKRADISAPSAASSATKRAKSRPSASLVTFLERGTM